MLPPLKLDALTSGIFGIFMLVIVDTMFIIFALSLLSGVIPADLLYPALRVIVIASMLLPAYFVARRAHESPVYHSFLMGLIEALILTLMMIFTFSWQGTAHDYVVGRVPLVITTTLLLNLATGWMVKKTSRRRN